jgi:hypothetical protein
VAFPDVDHLAEVRKAYAFEVVRGFPKKDRARFLANWMSRSQEWAERRMVRTATVPRGFASPRSAPGPILSPFRGAEGPVGGFDLEQEMDEYLQKAQICGRAQA